MPYSVLSLATYPLKKTVFLRYRKLYALFPSSSTFNAADVSIEVTDVGRFSVDMLFIAIACVVFEMKNRLRKRTTIGINRDMTASSLLSLYVCRLHSPVQQRSISDDISFNFFAVVSLKGRRV